MATTATTDDTVIDLESHPVWRSAQRYSREVSEAMRRHPSYLAKMPATPSA
ncbi:hypothetical protein ACWDTP_08475 [Mycobacterium sp. NPDC003449]